MGDRPLTEKELKFIECYMQHAEKKRAAIEAGYSEATAAQQGSQVYAREHVRAEIDRRRAERAKTTGMTALEVIEELKQIKDEARSLIPPQYNAAIKALELIGKHEGMWKERPTDHNHSGEIILTVRDYTTKKK